MLTAYLANNIQNRAFMVNVAIELLKEQVAVNSRWIWGDEAAATPTEEDMERHAREDMEDVESADVFIYYADQEKIGLGKHVELGIALQARKPIFIVGKPSRDSVFFRLVPENRRLDSFDELVTAIRDEGLL